MTSPIERKHEVAIAALLQYPTIAEAAKTVGVGEKTLHRWLQQPAFADAYRRARARTLDIAVGRLHGHLGLAIATLERAMTSGNPAIEVRAATAVIAHAFRGAELLDLAERLAALEAAEERRAWE